LKNQPINNQNDQLSLFNYFEIVKKHKKIIYGTTGVFFILGFLYYLRSPNLYKADATIVPIISEKNNISQVLGSLNLPNINLGFGGMGKNNDLLTIVLESRSLAEKVIQKLNLMKVIHKNLWDEKSNNWKTENWLGKDLKPPSLSQTAKGFSLNSIKVYVDRSTNLIKVTTFFNDPILAMSIANAYVSELKKYLSENITTAVKRKRLFVEKQLGETANKVRHLDEALMIFSQNQNTAVPSLTTVALSSAMHDVLASASESLSEIASQEVEIQVLKNISTDSPQINSLKSDIERRRAAINSLFKETINQNEAGNKIFVPLSKVPLLAMEYGRIKIERTIQEQIYTLLKQEYEMAKIEESKEDISFLAVDNAILQAEKVSPQFKKIIILSLLIGLFSSVSFIFIMSFFKEEKVNFQTTH
jgi:uncharacterized protein involved in exopolysaccharide biosynthesis